MLELIQTGLGGLLMGLGALTLSQCIMIILGCVLLYLGIKKDCEPLLLVPIGFGAILVNIPLGGMMADGGLFKEFYNMGVINEVFPCLIFVGIGAMTDFSPLLENPKILLLGAAGQFGIFLTLMLALLLGFDLMDATAIGIIGACDGPTSIYVTSKYAPHLLGAVSVAAYSYMALVPIIQPPIMRLLTTKKEKVIRMEYPERSVSPTLKIVFPIAVTVLTCLLAPMGTPLMGTLMLGNLMKDCGVVSRLTKSAENELANIVTLLLGLSIGATMEAGAFLKGQTILILCLGFVAICLDTVAGVLFGKLMCVLSKGKVNPLVGAAGISAYPMAARVVQLEGRRWDPNNWLLMHAMGANTGGQVGSIMAAAIILSVLKGMGVA
ncbi:MAG: sodium ion-translocating decarboxylase subunit beta [Desulfobacteraceae bacterium]|nr:sodium ion-translocating decarboxylase subunit beta [Desulfobacteraceae bacterium]